MLVPFGVSAIPLAIILLEPDLGTALLLLPVLFIMLFAAGARTSHLALIAVVVAITLGLLGGQLDKTFNNILNKLANP